MAPKRANTQGASSSRQSRRSRRESPPVIRRDGIQERWHSRNLNFEATFDIDELYAMFPETRWGISDIRRRRADSIFSPSSTTIYPRLVKVFYQNLMLKPDERGVLISSIDGTEIRVDMSTIANAMQCPHDCPYELTETYSPLPDDLSVGTLVNRLCSDQFSGPKHNAASKSSMPNHLWFLDAVLYKNVCPIGHKTERRQEFLRALYALHFGHWLSFPQIVWGQIEKFYSKVVAKTPAGASDWEFPFPTLIHQLLLAQGYEVDENELAFTRDIHYGTPDWNLSRSHMHQRVIAAPGDISRLAHHGEAVIPPPPVGEPEEVEDEAGVAQEGGQNYGHLEEQIAGLTTQFGALQTEVSNQFGSIRTEMTEHYRESRHEQRELRRMLRALMRQANLDPDAPSPPHH